MLGILNAQDIFKELIAIVKTKPDKNRTDALYLTSSGTTNFYVYNSDALKYENSIHLLWKLRSEVFNHITLKKFKVKILDFIGIMSSSESPISKDDINTFFSIILKLPIQKWEVFKPLYGCDFPALTPPVEFGCFKICNIHENKYNILEEYPHALVIFDEDLKHIRSNIYISVFVDNRDPYRAEELSNIHFLEFENIIRFLIGNSEIFNVSILDPHMGRAADSIIISNENLSTNTQYKGIYSNLPLMNPHFNNKDNGSFYIWEKLKSNHKSEMDKRILSAINWLGKGLKEDDPANSLIQYIFALEALFTFRPKGEFISSSIVSQLSEAAAFILSDDYERRKKYSKSVKDLYRLRSAIAHGGTNSIEFEDANGAFYLLNDIITQLLTHSELNNLQTIEMLHGWIENKKYS